MGQYGEVGGILSPDGRYLAAVEKPRKLVVYDLATGKVACRPAYPLTLTSLVKGNEGFLVLAFSADGQSLFYGSAKNFARFEIPSGKLIQRMGQEEFRFDFGAFTTSHISRDGGRCVRVATVFKRNVEDVNGEDSAIVLDTKTGKAIATIPVGSEMAVISPDGSRIISGGLPRTDKQAPKQDPKQDPKELQEARTELRRWLVVSDVDEQKEIVRWKITAPKPPFPQDRNYGTYDCVVFSPDGKTAAVAVEGVGVQLFDAATGGLVRSFPTELETRHLLLRFSPDGKTLVTGGKKLWAWKTATGEAVPLRWADVDAGIDSYRGFAFPGDGKSILVLADISHTLVWWDALGGKSSHPLVGDSLTGSLLGHTAYVDTIQFGEGGKSLVSASVDGRAYVWSPGTKTPPKVWKFGGKEYYERFPYFRTMEVSPGGKYVVGNRGVHFGCSAWDVSLGKNTFGRRFSRDDNAYPSAGAGAAGIVTSDGLSFRVWPNPEIKFDDPEPESRPFDDPSRIAIRVGLSPDQKIVSALLVPKKGAPPKTPAAHALFDAASGKRLHAFPETGVTSLSTFSPDGKWFFQNGRGQGEVYDVATGKLAAKLPLADEKMLISAAAFDPQSRRIALGLYQKAFVDKNEPCPIEIFDVSSGKSLRRLTGQLIVRSLAFAPDGEVLASGGDDQLIYLWSCGAAKK